MEQIKFRCSGLSKLMSSPRKKGEDLSETAKQFIIDSYIATKYERREDISNKFLQKGNEREEDSITLVSRTLKKFLRKNDKRIENEFITGEPDLFINDSGNIMEAEEILDTKTSWSMNTFFKSKMAELPDEYFWQGQGYMALTGAKKHHVCFCLVNGLLKHIDDEKRRKAWQLGLIDMDDQNTEFIKACLQIERNMIFDMGAFKRENPHSDLMYDNWQTWNHDVDWKERIHIKTIERDESSIELIYEKVKIANRWMKEKF